MPEEPKPQTEKTEAAEPELEELRKAVQGARARLKRLATAETLTPQALALELSGTVLPLLGESLDFIDRLEEHAEYVSEQLEAMEGLRSQLLPDDAEKFVAYIQTVHGVADASLADMDPTSPAAAGLLKLKELGDELLHRIDEIRVDGDDDEEDEDDDEEDEDGLPVSDFS